VGAQADVRYATTRLRPIERTVRDFVAAVLDRSPSIGVRGELTRDYLAELGFRDVEVIGCPSLFIGGPDLHVEKRRPTLGPDARIALNVSPYVKAMGPIVARHAERYPNLTYIPQDIETLETLLWGPRDDAIDPGDPRPIHLEHPLFRADKVRFFVDPWPWIAFLRGMDFSFGTRIHGNITALMAGTPAVVLAHDSRTLELVRYFEIPHRLMPEVAPDLDAADLFAEADFTAFNAGHPARWEVFAAFLARHGLDHAFAAPQAATAWAGRMATTAFPPAVTVGSRLDAGLVGGRVRVLRRRVRRLARQPWALRLRVVVASLLGGRRPWRRDGPEADRPA
jgi:hypothetical protein